MVPHRLVEAQVVGTGRGLVVGTSHSAGCPFGFAGHHAISQAERGSCDSPSLGLLLASEDRLECVLRIVV